MAAPRRILAGSARVDLGPLLAEPDALVVERLRRVSDVAIARALPTVPEEDAARVLTILPPERASAVFRRLATVERAGLLEILSAPLRARLFRALQRDEQADVVAEVPDDLRESLISKLPIEERRELKSLLKFPPDHLASIMTPNVPTFRESSTIAEAIETLRRYSDDESVTIHYVYVVDDLDRLTGVLSIRDLVNLRGDRRLGEFAHRDVTTLSLHMDPEEAARIQQASAWRSLPVVDADGRVAGVLTDEDATAFLAIEETEDFQRFGGMQPVESAYLRTGVPTFFRKRAGWLLVLFIAELLTTAILRYYERPLEEMVVLAFFLPLLIATGGNVGSQSTSLIVRALALGEVSPRNVLLVLWKEAGTGLLLGGLMGVVAILRIEMWGLPRALAIVVATSILAVCVFAAVVGGILPLLIARLDMDPAVMSAPLIATVVDAVGVVIYLSLAVFVLQI